MGLFSKVGQRIEAAIDRAQTCGQCGCNAVGPWCWSCTAPDCECTPGVGCDEADARPQDKKTGGR